MKIVKWVTGYDHSTDSSECLYPSLRSKLAALPREEASKAWEEAERVVKECIRKNGFKFSGEYHQYGEYGMPMFEDGSVMYCSWRHWGAIMAEAWDVDDGRGHGYLDFYMTLGDKPIAPKHELDFVP